MRLSLVEGGTPESSRTAAAAATGLRRAATSPQPRRQLAALLETAARVATSLDVEEVLQTIVQHAKDLLAPDVSYITLMDRDRAHVRMRVSVGTRTPAFMDIVLPIGEGLGGAVAREARSTYTSDYLNDSRITHDAAVDDAVRAEGIRSILGVPLIGRSEVVGVLYVANRHVEAFE